LNSETYILYRRGLLCQTKRLAGTNSYYPNSTPLPLAQCARMMGSTSMSSVPPADIICDLSVPLRELIEREVSCLPALPDATAGLRAGGAGTWSPKEELGHLIDSAANNHIRFVRAQIEPEFRGPAYAQEAWVQAHAYQEMPWLAVVDFWFRYNEFLTTFLSRVKETKIQTMCYVGSGAGVSLKFLVDDYVLHMQHHVDHALGRECVTPYPAAAPVAALL